MIRPYRSSDLPVLREITGICFGGASVDANIERKFGPLGECTWQERKARTVEADALANPDGIFVYETDRSLIGYITCRIDALSRVGRIPNMSVLPGHRKQGVGKALMERALDYFRGTGMELVRIETLEQNQIGATFYPRMGFQEVARQIHYALPLRDRERS